MRLSSKERVDRALNGNRSPDRPPFSFWHHFGLQNEPPENHARATIAFHREFHTDLVKVMSDFPYPKPAGNCFGLTVEEDPFAPQIRALELIREGAGASGIFLAIANAQPEILSEDDYAKWSEPYDRIVLDAGMFRAQ